MNKPPLRDRPEIERKVMSKDDELIFILKHGHAPTFQINIKTYYDEDDKETPHKMKYYLTNIPESDESD
jgi:hypothetical protein